MHQLREKVIADLCGLYDEFLKRHKTCKTRMCADTTGGWDMAAAAYADAMTLVDQLRKQITLEGKDDDTIKKS